MSFDRLSAVKVAKEICDRITPVCERLCVAGSLRRRKTQVGDIEIVFIPKVEPRKIDLLTVADVSLADDVLERLLAEKVLAKRPNVNGSFTWGPQNKFAVHVASGIPVDFFATIERNWWTTKVIRTGSAQMNIQLCSSAIKIGRRLHAYGAGFTDTDGSLLVCNSEEDVFRLAGLKYREPWQRG